VQIDIRAKGEDTYCMFARSLAITYALNTFVEFVSCYPNGIYWDFMNTEWKLFTLKVGFFILTDQVWCSVLHAPVKRTPPLSPTTSVCFCNTEQTFMKYVILH